MCIFVGDVVDISKLKPEERKKLQERLQRRKEELEARLGRINKELAKARK